jgi:paraquat-inducible protein B
MGEGRDANMTRATGEKSDHSRAHPKPVVKKMRWPIVLIWIVPIFAALMAGYYFFDLYQNRWLQISLTFSDANGLKAGQSKVMHLGVVIGQVADIQLSPDQKHVVVQVDLQRSAESFAKSGAMYWIVRPEISTQSISGLGTVLSGPFIDSNPGTGEMQKEFTGLDKAPPSPEEGLRIVLKAPRLEHLQPDTPVYFRGIEVGAIEDVQLSNDATSVDVHAFIRHRYSPLVKSNSEFWVVSAVDFKGGLFTGIQMKVESLRSLLSGGIAFATPEKKMGEQAQNGSEFVLNDEPKKDWLTWAPAISIQPDDGGTTPSSTTLPESGQAIRSAVGAP